MGRNKQLKIDEFNRWPNCVNMDEALAGNWQKHFGNDNPIVLELGCGKGDLSVGLARINPNKNYIGVDIKGVRMWTGAQAAMEEGLKNVAFLRADIHGIGQFFADQEVDDIWITFPDPFPKLKQTKNRMIHQRFLKQYVAMLKPEGQIFFKTDNNSLFEYALAHFEELTEKEVFEIETFDVTRDIRSSKFTNADNGITTDYERRFMDMGKSINYMRFTLKAGPMLGKLPEMERIALDSSERAPRARWIFAFCIRFS